MVEFSKLTPLEQKFVEKVSTLDVLEIMELPYFLQPDEPDRYIMSSHLGGKFKEDEWAGINRNRPRMEGIIYQILEQRKEKCVKG
jgi:hypothetical protein